MLFEFCLLLFSEERRYHFTTNFQQGLDQIRKFALQWFWKRVCPHYEVALLSGAKARALEQSQFDMGL